MLPLDMKLYSAPVSNHDGSITISLRFAMTDEEFEFAHANGLIPPDTSLIEMIENMPSLHDFHFSPSTLQ